MSHKLPLMKRNTVLLTWNQMIPNLTWFLPLNMKVKIYRNKAHTPNDREAWSPQNHLSSSTKKTTHARFHRRYKELFQMTIGQRVSSKLKGVANAPKLSQPCRTWTSQIRKQAILFQKCKRTAWVIIRIRRLLRKSWRIKRTFCVRICLSNAKSCAITSRKCIKTLTKFSTKSSTECSTGYSSKTKKS